MSEAPLSGGWIDPSGWSLQRLEVDQDFANDVGGTALRWVDLAGHCDTCWLAAATLANPLQPQSCKAGLACRCRKHSCSGWLRCQWSEACGPFSHTHCTPPAPCFSCAARYAIIAHVVHLVNRDYTAMCYDYYT